MDIHPRYLFSKIFAELLFGWTLNVSANFEVCIALSIPEIIAIEVLVGVAHPNLGEEAAVGGRNGTVRKSIAEFLG